MSIEPKEYYTGHRIIHHYDRFTREELIGCEVEYNLAKRGLSDKGKINAAFEIEWEDDTIPNTVIDTPDGLKILEECHIF